MFAHSEVRGPATAVPIFRRGIKMVAISGGRKGKREREREREGGVQKAHPSGAAAYLILTSFESQSW